MDVRIAHNLLVALAPQLQQAQAVMEAAEVLRGIVAASQANREAPAAGGGDGSATAGSSAG